MLAVASVLVMALASFVGTTELGFAATVPGAHIGPASAAATPSAAAPPDKACAVSSNDTKCQSTDTLLTVDIVNTGDTSDCTFLTQINWDDKSKPQDVKHSGYSESGTYYLADHTYGTPSSRTYSITERPLYVTGGCTEGSPTYKFTLVVPPCAADDTSQGTGSGPPASAVGQTETAVTRPGYFYVAAHQSASADGAQGRFLVADPKVGGSECHSLAEMAVESGDGKQIIEVGWTVDPQQFGGSTKPHLFVFYWVNGDPMCYDEGCGFEPKGDLAGSVLEVGSEPVFTIRYVADKWEIWDNSTLVGFYPESLWEAAKKPTSFTKAGLTQWFGEVSANPKTTEPCSQMGTGKFPDVGAGADEISGMTLLGGPRVSFWLLTSAPSFYKGERVPADDHYANTMRFGGPGASSCSS
jgi:hypothetical protein